MAVSKTIELEGSSPNNWHQAVQEAVSVAARTLRNITAVDVIQSSCEIAHNHIISYKVRVKLSFLVESVSESVS